MSDISKDAANIWSRLFDHKGFLSGEISLTLQKFEQQRGDTEVDNLFTIIETITDIKDTEIQRFKQAVGQNLPQVNEELKQAASVCDRFVELENRYKQENLLDESRQKRKESWEHFMDHITTSYAEVNSITESRQEELTKLYSDLEKKLKP